MNLPVVNNPTVAARFWDAGTKWFARVVLLGAAAYVITVIAAGAITPGYDHGRQLISELGEVGAPAATVMSIMLIAVGCSLVIFAAALGSVSELATPVGRGWLSALGGGLVLGGLFPCDPSCAPATFSGWAHILTSIPATLGTVIAPFVFAARLRTHGFRRAALVNFLLGITTLMALLSAVFVFPSFGCQGIGQRFATILPLAWVSFLAYLVLRPPRRERFPEGPSLVDTLRRLGDRRDPVGLIRRLSRDHGPIVGLDLFGLRFCLLTDPALIDDLFINHASSLRQWGLSQFDLVLGRGLLTSEGNLWLRQRRLLQPHFTKKRVSTYDTDIARLATQLVDGWSDGDVIEVHGTGLRISTRIANALLFGDDSSTMEHLVEDTHQLLMNHFEDALTGFPIPLRVPTPANLRVRRSIFSLDEAIAAVITKRRAEGTVGDDFLGTLLDAQMECPDIDDALVRDECVTILLAASETTGVVFSWTMYLLARNAKVANDLANAIDNELGEDDVPTGAHVARLPGLAHAILESMRLYTPVWAIGRVAIEDCSVGDYVLRAGTQIFVAPLLPHRDSRWFDEPMTFQPDRWAGPPDCPHARSARAAYRPFGSGPRKCIGADLAMLELSILLLCILRRFRIELVADGKLPEEQASVTLRPRGGIHVRMRARADYRSSMSGDSPPN